MVIEKVRIQNYGAYEDVEVSFDRGIIGIIGENGGGKSLLLESILFALYGKSPRGGLGDVYNTAGRGDLCVEVTFRARQESVRVLRTWNSDGGSLLRLSLGDSAVEGAVREVQARINELVGLTYPCFIASSFFLQRKSDLFTAASAAERLSYMREILSLGFWDDCYERVAEDHKDRGAAVLRAIGMLETQEAFLSQARQSVGLVTEQQLVADVEAWAATVQGLETRKDELLRARAKREAAMGQEEVWARQRDAILKQLISLRQWKQHVPRFLKAFRRSPQYEKAVAIEFELHSRTIAALEVRIEQAEKLAQIPDLQGTCPTCLQEIDPNHLDIVRRQASQELENLQPLLYQAQDRRELAVYAADEYRGRMQHNAATSEIVISLQQASSLEAQLVEVESRLREIQVPEVPGSVAQVQVEYEGAVARWHGSQMRLASHRETSKRIGQLEEERDVAKAVLEVLEKEVSEFFQLKGIFSRTGLSFYIIQKVIQGELQTLCNQILATLSTYRVQFFLKTSTDRNTLEVWVLDDNQVARKYETFSGAEGEMINFSIRMALSRLLRRRGEGQPVEFVVLDEIFGFFDREHLPAMESALASLKGEFEQIFVISHVPLQLKFDQTIEVRKVQSKSVIM